MGSNAGRGSSAGVRPRARCCRGAQRKQVARGARLGAAHHDDVGEDPLDRLGCRGVDRSLAGQHAAQEPARPVVPDEPGRPVARTTLGRADRQACEQLAAERPRQVVGRTALLDHRLGDLGADVVPDPLGPGGSEGLDLERGAVDADRDGRDLAPVALSTSMRSSMPGTPGSQIAPTSTRWPRPSTSSTSHGPPVRTTQGVRARVLGVWTRWRGWSRRCSACSDPQTGPCRRRWRSPSATANCRWRLPLRWPGRGASG